MIEEHLDHPVLFKGNALARTCRTTWYKLGGTHVYRRSAVIDRDNTLRAKELCQAIEDDSYWNTQESKKEMDWLIHVARRGMGPIERDDVISTSSGNFGPEYEFYWNAEDEDEDPRSFGDLWGPPENPKYNLGRLASKTFLNRAIVHCPDLAVLEDIIDEYAHIFPAAFTGAWVGPLVELQPIHAAVRAKRSDVVQLLVSKGLAPVSIDSLFGRPRVEVDWAVSSTSSRFSNPYHTLDATPFSIAFSGRDEDSCIALLEDDGHSGLKHNPADGVNQMWQKLTTFLAIAEFNGMYKLIPALIEHWKSVCPTSEHNLRRIMDMSMKVVAVRDSFNSTRSCAPEADDVKTVIYHLLEFGADRDTEVEEGDGILLSAARQCYWKGVMIILRHQFNKGSINLDELEATLLHVAKATFGGSKFFVQMWRYCEPWLYRKDLSAEDNAQRVAQFTNQCLEVTLGADRQFDRLSGNSHQASLYLLKKVVKPELFHLRAAIKVWDHDMVSELISRGKFDLKATWSGFEGLTPFEYALHVWNEKVGASSRNNNRDGITPVRPDMTMLLKLVYLGGAPDKVSKKTKSIIRFLFTVDFGRAEEWAWYNRGTEIQEKAVHPDAWNREALIDPTVPRLDRLTTFHLLMQKQFNLNKNMLPPWGEAKPWFLTGNFEKHLPPSYV